MIQYELKCLCGSRVAKIWTNVQNTKYNVHKCLECGIFYSNKLRETDVEKLYCENSLYHVREQVKIGHIPYDMRFDHDYNVASMRLERFKDFLYAITPDVELDFSGKRVLDIGCSNGAFLKRCADEDMKINGIEINSHIAQFAENRLKDSFDRDITQFIRHRSLDNSWYPSSFFDFVFCHDMLEHLREPVLGLMEIQRLVKDNGFFILDMPDVGCKEFEEQQMNWKHIRPNEHLWLFGKRQTLDIFKQTNFKVEFVDRPIEGKIVFYCKKVKSKVQKYFESNGSRENSEVLKIAVPSGTGDIAWVYAKLSRLGKKIKFYISDDGPRRAHDFLDILENVEYQYDTTLTSHYTYKATIPSDITVEKFLEMCRESSDPINIAPNLHLECGVRIEDWMPNFAADFNFKDKMKLKKFADVRDIVSYKKNERLIGIYPACYGPIAEWHGWDAAKWMFLISGINKAIPNCKFVLISAPFDERLVFDIQKLLVAKKVNFSNIRGHADFCDILSLSQQFEFVIGHASGLSILMSYLGVKSYLFYAPHLDRLMYSWPNPEDILHSRYHANIFTESPQDTFQWVKDHFIYTKDVIQDDWNKQADIQHIWKTRH